MSKSYSHHRNFFGTQTFPWSDLSSSVQHGLLGLGYDEDKWDEGIVFFDDRIFGQWTPYEVLGDDIQDSLIEIEIDEEAWETTYRELYLLTARRKVRIRTFDFFSEIKLL